jgi:glycosyltransferase involved in cell wall biosynthesis
LPDANLFSMGQMAMCCKESWVRKSSAEEEQASPVLRKIAAMTIALNEETTLSFTVGALLPKVDLYIVVDTGTEDRGFDILRQLFKREIMIGKLVISKMTVGQNISEARNFALKFARSQNCSHVLKVDADDVFYDGGASILTAMIRAMPNSVQVVWLPQWELVQSTIDDSSEWLKSVEEDVWNVSGARQARFSRRTDMMFGHDRVYALTDDLEARGGWTDESRGLPAESLYYLRRGKFQFFASEFPLMVHYGWARPLKRLKEKTGQWGIRWTGQFPDIGKNQDGIFSLVPFSQHPEVVARYSRDVLSLLGFNHTGGD